MPGNWGKRGEFWSGQVGGKTGGQRDEEGEGRNVDSLSITRSQSSVEGTTGWSKRTFDAFHRFSRNRKRAT